ncbi:hypothetical protein DFH09DRAFT_1112210 [Mycena vulgaris]|nr:hypothetical protein DFH09DRAFT_1112210 [Mycena vulgaris]
MFVSIANCAGIIPEDLARFQPRLLRTEAATCNFSVGIKNSQKRSALHLYAGMPSFIVTDSNKRVNAVSVSPDPHIASWPKSRSAFVSRLPGNVAGVLNLLPIQHHRANLPLGSVYAARYIRLVYADPCISGRGPPCLPLKSNTLSTVKVERFPYPTLGDTEIDSWVNFDLARPAFTAQAYSHLLDPLLPNSESARSIWIPDEQPPKLGPHFILPEFDCDVIYQLPLPSTIAHLQCVVEIFVVLSRPFIRFAYLERLCWVVRIIALGVEGGGGREGGGRGVRGRGFVTREGGGAEGGGGMVEEAMLGGGGREEFIGVVCGGGGGLNEGRDLAHGVDQAQALRGVHRVHRIIEPSTSAVGDAMGSAKTDPVRRAQVMYGEGADCLAINVLSVLPNTRRVDPNSVVAKVMAAFSRYPRSERRFAPCVLRAGVLLERLPSQRQPISLCFGVFKWHPRFHAQVSALDWCFVMAAVAFQPDAESETACKSAAADHRKDRCAYFVRPGDGGGRDGSGGALESVGIAIQDAGYISPGSDGPILKFTTNSLGAEFCGNSCGLMILNHSHRRPQTRQGTELGHRWDSSKIASAKAFKFRHPSFDVRASFGPGGGSAMARNTAELELRTRAKNKVAR